ncbi:MAG: hypothetical protein KF774_21390 [Planctomyces sp.]|nr:hypothetical protein [Planctomyces sp.]
MLVASPGSSACAYGFSDDSLIDGRLYYVEADPARAAEAPKFDPLTQPLPLSMRDAMAAAHRKVKDIGDRPDDWMLAGATLERLGEHHWWWDVVLHRPSEEEGPRKWFRDAFRAKVCLDGHVGDVRKRVRFVELEWKTERRPRQEPPVEGPIQWDCHYNGREILVTVDKELTRSTKALSSDRADPEIDAARAIRLALENIEKNLKTPEKWAPVTAHYRWLSADSWYWSIEFLAADPAKEDSTYVIVYPSGDVTLPKL